MPRGSCHAGVCHTPGKRRKSAGAQGERWAPLELPAGTPPFAEQQETSNQTELKMQIRRMVCLTPRTGKPQRAWDKFQRFWHTSPSHLTGISSLEPFLKKNILSHGTMKAL